MHTKIQRKIPKSHTPGGTKYALDEEGYIKVEFRDSDGRLLEMDELTKKFSKLTISRPEPSFIEAIPPQYIKAADQGKLTREMLLEMEYTDLIRLAAYQRASKKIYDLIGIRGVPLRWGVDPITKEALVEPYRLKPHQIKAIPWILGREGLDRVSSHGLQGGILVLKMGLGKTLISIVSTLVAKKGDFPTLIVASKTVMHEWKTEGVEKFFGNSIKVLYLHKDFMGKEYDRVTRRQIKEYDLVITTYDSCVQACRRGGYHEQCYEMGDEHTLMKGKIAAIHLRTKELSDLPNVVGGGVIYGTPWERVICDESQRYANPKTMTYKCIMAIYGRYKWCLTGTPIRNYDTDIWAQLRFCGYNGVTQALEWKRYGNSKFREHHLKEAIFTMDYKDANVTLPPKTENEILIQLKGKQRQAYEYILGETKGMYDKMMNNLCSFACVLAMFTRLRQCAIAPYLLTAESKREKLKGKQAQADKEAVELLKKMTSGGVGKWCHEKEGEAGIYSEKISQIVDTISRIPKGEKVLVFSMFTSCLDLLADALKERLPDFQFVQVDGDTKGQERSDLLRQFRTDPDTRGLFLTYKVGSEGLNLTEATHCICIEPWWTSAVPNQAKARLWRTGQTKPVFIHNILVQDSIEEQVVAICKEKEEMAASYLDGTEKPLGKKVGLDKYTLGRILGIR
jgi:SNF2 family DNA or RNA helicase